MSEKLDFLRTVKPFDRLPEDVLAEVAEGLEEVRHLEGADQWRLGNVRDYLSTRSDDPWSDYGNTRQRLREGR